MSNELVRRMEASLEAKSLTDLVQAVTDEVFLLIDTSGSMAAQLDVEKRAIDALRDVVRDIRTQGSCPMIAFGGPYDMPVRFVDVVPEPAGGTPLAQALQLAKDYGATRVVVISDGAPDGGTEFNLEAARLFGGQIDVVYIGEPGSAGELFLKKLAEATGGSGMGGDLRKPKELTRGIIGLLEGPSEASSVVMGEGFSTVERVEEEPEDDEDSDDDDEEEDDEDDE